MNTHETIQTIKGMYIGKATKDLKSLYRGNVCHPIVTMVELVGVPRPNHWDAGSVAQKSDELLLHMLKNVESYAGLKGSDVDSLVI